MISCKTESDIKIMNVQIPALSETEKHQNFLR